MNSSTTTHAKVPSRIQLNKSSSSSNISSSTLKVERSNSAPLICNILDENSSGSVTDRRAKVQHNIDYKNDSDSLYSSDNASYSKDPFEALSDDLVGPTVEAQVKTLFNKKSHSVEENQKTTSSHNSERIKSSRNERVSSKPSNSEGSVLLGNMVLKNQKTPLKLNPYNEKLNILKKFNLTTKDNWKIKHKDVWQNIDKVKDVNAMNKQRDADLKLKLDCASNAKSVVSEVKLSQKQQSINIGLKVREMGGKNITTPKLASLPKGKESWQNIDKVKDVNAMNKQRDADLKLKLDYVSNAKSVVREVKLSERQQSINSRLKDIGLKEKEMGWKNTTPILTTPKLASLPKGKERQCGYLQNILARKVSSRTGNRMASF